MDGLVAILGAGGFAREMYWHLRDACPRARAVFVDDLSDTREVLIAETTIPVVKDWRFDAIRIDGPNRPTAACRQFVIGVGHPATRRLLVGKALASGLAPIPTVVHPRALVQGGDCTIGVGGVIAPGCVVTANVCIGDFVLLGVNVAIGHDVVIGDYVTCNPGCQVSGNVRLGSGVLVGAGATIREQITIAPDVVVGAQACVVKNVDESGTTVAGVPARRLR